MDSNRDDASLALERAHKAVSGGDLAKARRLLEKSIRMYPHEPLLSAQARCAAAIRTAQPVPPRRPPSPEPQRDATAHMIAVVRRVQVASKKGHYDVLGLKPAASEADIRKAFRKLALLLHPDKNIAPGAEDAFKKVSRANEVLSDPAKRKRYDQFGVDDDSPLGMGGQSSAGNPGNSRNSRRRRRGGAAAWGHGGGPTSEEEVLLNSMTPEEIFEFLFTAAAASGAGRGARYAGGPGLFGGGAQRADAYPAEDQSLWARFKPLSILCALVILLLLLGSGGEARHFSLRQTPSLGVRKSTSCGVEFFISRFQRIDGNDPKNIFEWHSAVHREALYDLQLNCEAERSEYASLVRMSKSWLSLQSTRDHYARRARDFKRHATACLQARDLEICSRERGER